MLPDQPKPRPTKTSPPLRPKDLDLSNDDLSDLILSETMNKTIDFYQILSRACEKQVIRLLIPETLMWEAPGSLVFLYTDGEGVIRKIKGEK